jgi:hypothetical protein
MDKLDAINEAAKKYALQSDLITYGVVGKEAFKTGALSNAAKEYWLEQFQKELKIKDKAIEICFETLRALFKDNPNLKPDING